MPLGSAQQYLAKYNGYQLPGYVQEESFDSRMNIADHYGAYIDGSYSEQTGLGNKDLTLTLKVWEQDYITCKNAVQKAATILRTKKDGYADLYVLYNDRHYEAMAGSVKISKTAGASVRTLNYQASFSCRPWLIRDSTHTLTGTGIINTDQVSRTIDDGGWTPTVVTVTGTNVTISGYTDTIPYTGFISVIGAVSSLVVDSDAFTAEISSVNANDKMANVDYRLFVGPEKTYFNITGASSCSIQYHDRWNL